MPTPITPVDVSPSTGSYLDVDVTAHVGGDAGNVAGVILHLVNTSGTSYTWGVRKNGSSDTLEDRLTLNAHTFVHIGVDSSDIFEANIQNAAIEIRMVGYWLNSEASFFTNSIDKSITTLAAWTDVVISGDTGADTAVMAFLKLHSVTSTTRKNSVRKNGSTDDFQDFVQGLTILGGAIGVDGSEIFETYISSTDADLYLTGYATANVTTFANGKGYPATGTGAYEDVDVSADVPSGNNGMFGLFRPTTFTVYSFGIMKKGAGYDRYFDARMHQFVWTELDANRIAEQKVEHADLDLWVQGYSNTAVADTIDTAAKRFSMLGF